MKIDVEEKRLNGARYYTASPYVDGLNSVETLREWLVLEDWCWDNFGERPMNRWPDSGDRWFANNNAFWFKDEQDLMMFMLRWS